MTVDVSSAENDTNTMTTSDLIFTTQDSNTNGKKRVAILTHKMGKPRNNPTVEIDGDQESAGENDLKDGLNSKFAVMKTPDIVKKAICRSSDGRTPKNLDSNSIPKLLRSGRDAHQRLNSSYEFSKNDRVDPTPFANRRPSDNN